MLEGLKKFVNWNNGTITELYDFIDVYEERAIVAADEDIKYLVQKLFNVVFKQADLRMSQISKTYCTLALARMSSDVTRNSKNCDSESKALIQLLLGSYLDIYKSIYKKDDGEIDQEVEKIYYIETTTPRPKSKEELAQLYNKITKVMNDEKFDIYEQGLDEEKLAPLYDNVLNGERPCHMLSANYLEVLEKENRQFRLNSCL